MRHPLALAAAKAVLLHLKEKGPDLQKNLTARTAQLADQLRAIIDEFQAPYQLTQFMSLMQLGFPSEQKFAGLLYYLLRERGIHIWDNRAFVITTAHTEADFADCWRRSVTACRRWWMPASCRRRQVPERNRAGREMTGSLRRR